MANTYSQINIHCVFAVKGRENIITKNFQDELHSYIAGILKGDGCYPLAVGGWKNHVHAFFELPVTLSVSKEMQLVKATSSKWINDHHFVKAHQSDGRGKFSWQEGFGAFSLSRSQRDPAIRYIMNQEQHHRLKTFREEYFDLLKKFQITYDERYVFEFYE